MLARSSLRSEHPDDEADNVVMNGRVLGGLEPSRAFGDARYKWPIGMQELYVFTLRLFVPMVNHSQLESSIHGWQWYPSAQTTKNIQNTTVREHCFVNELGLTLKST